MPQTKNTFQKLLIVRSKPNRGEPRVPSRERRPIPSVSLAAICSWRYRENDRDVIYKVIQFSVLWSSRLSRLSPNNKDPESKPKDNSSSMSSSDSEAELEGCLATAATCSRGVWIMLQLAAGCSRGVWILLQHAAGVFGFAVIFLNDPRPLLLLWHFRVT
ncbi:hypothetical protein Tco_1439314 [Tanacetum coccineum]